MPPFPKAKVGWTWLSGALGHQRVSMGAAWCNEPWLAVGARGAGQGQQQRSCSRAGGRTPLHKKITCGRPADSGSFYCCCLHSFGFLKLLHSRLCPVCLQVVFYENSAIIIFPTEWTPTVSFITKINHPCFSISC